MTKKQRSRRLPRERALRPVAVATVAAPPARRAVPAAAPPAVEAVVPPVRWRRLDTLIVAGIVLAALVFYCWRLETPDGYVFDEVYHGFTAAEIVKGNADAWVFFTTPPPGVAYEWTHPAMSKVLIGIGIRIFGDNSVGWRASSAVFGALGVGLIYAMGRVMFGRWVGVLAAALLAMEGLWYVQSRISMNDVFLTVFIMLGYAGLYMYLRGPAERTRRWLWLAGPAMGAGFATKWSAGYSFALIGAIVLGREVWVFLKGRGAWQERVRRALPIVGLLAAAFVVIPALTYLVAYTQFFTMGHSFDTWRELQRQMWEYHSNLKATHPWQSRWWTWPLMITPVWYYVDAPVDSAKQANIYALGNPLIFWAFLPAVAFALYSWYEGRFRNAALTVVVAGFFGQWLPWMLSPRISFFYHMTPVVPFGILAIAYALGRMRAPRLVLAGYMLPVLLAFIYFFPIYSAWPISREYLEQHYWLERWRPHN